MGLILILWIHARSSQFIKKNAFLLFIFISSFVPKVCSTRRDYGKNERRLVELKDCPQVWKSICIGIRGVVRIFLL